VIQVLTQIYTHGLSYFVNKSTQHTMQGSWPSSRTT
jgi:hypothetical protein